MQLDWFLVAILTLGESVHPLGKSSGHQQALLLVPGRLLKTTAVEKKTPATCTKAIDTRLLGLTFQVRLVSFGGWPQKKRPTKKRWDVDEKPKTDGDFIMKDLDSTEKRSFFSPWKSSKTQISPTEIVIKNRFPLGFQHQDELHSMMI